MLSLVQVSTGRWQVHLRVQKKKLKWQGFRIPRWIEHYEHLPQPVAWLDDIVVYETPNRKHAELVADGGDFNENIDVS